jgi:hypothetical protein
MSDAPELYQGLSDIFTAFWKLDSDRPIGMVAGRIPWSSIDRYARRFDITNDEDFHRFEYLIREMDDAWIVHHNPPKSG